MNERELAVREGAQNAAESGYFDNRPQLDGLDRRRVFAGGFQRGWDAAAPQYPFGIPEDRIQQIVDALPGGLNGYLKTWGWLDFARAIEFEQGIQAE